MTLTSTSKDRLEALLSRFLAQRQRLEDALNSIDPADSVLGTEWSAVDLLRHLNGRQYVGQLDRLLQEENPVFGGGGGAFSADAAWRRTMDQSLAAIDEAIRYAETLEPEQLTRSGTRASGATFTVLDVLTVWADHYDDHLNQLTMEIVPRIATLRP